MCVTACNWQNLVYQGLSPKINKLTFAKHREITILPLHSSCDSTRLRGSPDHCHDFIRPHTFILSTTFHRYIMFFKSQLK